MAAKKIRILCPTTLEGLTIHSAKPLIGKQLRCIMGRPIALSEEDLYEVDFIEDNDPDIVKLETNKGIRYLIAAKACGHGELSILKNMMVEG